MADETRNPVEARRAILQCIDRLDEHLVGRREPLELMALAVAAGEPLLLLGPPGTAKSAMVGLFREAVGVPDEHYFEYLLTAFTEPSELIGPIDIQELRTHGVLRRRLEGRIADAHIVFLDEIFHANGAVLNTLLSVLNERKVFDGQRHRPIEGLVGFFAASNEIPADGDLAALKDRFILKVDLDFVGMRALDTLLQRGILHEIRRRSGTKPWVVPGAVGLADFLTVRRHVDASLERAFSGAADMAAIPAEVTMAFRRIVADLRSRGVLLSDREAVKLVRVAAFHAFLFRGASPQTLDITDLRIVRYIAETPEQFTLVKKVVDTVIGGAAAGADRAAVQGPAA